jgi:hypothetical protein
LRAKRGNLSYILGPTDITIVGIIEVGDGIGVFVGTLVGALVGEGDQSQGLFTPN